MIADVHARTHRVFRRDGLLCLLLCRRQGGRWALVYLFFKVGFALRMSPRYPIVFRYRTVFAPAQHLFKVWVPFTDTKAQTPSKRGRERQLGTIETLRRANPRRQGTRASVPHASTSKQVECNLSILGFIQRFSA